MTRMRMERFVNAVIRIALKVLMKIDERELAKIPDSGPAFFISNHTTNFEGPIYYVLIQPRRATGLAKMELWQNPVTRFFMQVWRMIPVNRGRLDTRAMKRADRALDEGYIMGIAPEGTRSKNGELQRGMPGIALLAARHRCPVVPVVQWGLNDFARNIVRFRRTPVHIRVGDAFVVRSAGERPTRTELRRMTDEIMYQLAVLLPERFRGVYSDLTQMTTDFIIKQ